jgi:hypothetical protein
MTEPNQNSESADSLLWLQRWYASHCDDEWEHERRVRIQTMDNPGWLVEIGLVGTHLELLRIDLVELGEWGDPNYVEYSVADAKFRGFCGADELGRLVGFFRKVWEQHQPFE